MDGNIHRSSRWMASYIKANGPQFKSLFLQCQEVLDHIQIIYNMSRDQCPIFLAIDYGQQFLKSQLHIRGLSSIKLISCIASSSEEILEQMNERGGLIPSRETRKKRRRSGFRYSSKKDLECSKLKRAAQTRASELVSVTKALSYQRALSSGGVSGSGGPFGLDGVQEQDGEELDLRQCRSMAEGECTLQVSTVEFRLKQRFMNRLSRDCWIDF
jgi:hypothetical protein